MIQTAHFLARPCRIFLINDFVTVVLALLKKNYTRLWQCLPPYYVKTVERMRQILPGLPEDYLQFLSTFPTTDIINEVIMSEIISGIRDDLGVLTFIDIVDHLTESDDTTSNIYIASLRNGTSFLQLAAA